MLQVNVSLVRQYPILCMYEPVEETWIVRVIYNIADAKYAQILRIAHH